MGATRMARSPRDGVVDEQCRVHGVSNLYIAGSSVFPTSGIANPTLTLLALTFRLGDHLTSGTKAQSWA
jgi:choline dehydrogenase-like flavoprotein